jgi:WD40 repeat protein
MGAAQKKGKAKKTKVEFERNLAVVIGINDYTHGIPPLKTAGNDARRLAQILADDYQYEVELLAQDVTLARLNTLLTETLPGRVNPDDRLLFYFAGHGIALEGEEGPAGHLIPQDARPEDEKNFLEMTQLHDALMDLACRHMLIILDCCFAGAMRWSTTRAVYVPPKEIHQERYEHFIQSRACQLITSAAYDQQALDILSGDILNTRGDQAEQEHSPFALALFEALAGAADTFPPAREGQPAGDGLLTVSELYQFIRDWVELSAESQAQHYQTPGLWPLKKHDKGEYVFLLPGRELNLPPAPKLTFDNNPYRGLQSFEEEHADLFFGRTALVEQLAQTVSAQPLTVVLGASGTGKSSLVKAGLVPYLRHQTPSPSKGGEQTSPPLGGIEGGWHILPPLRPGDSPVYQLGSLLRTHLFIADQPVKIAGPHSKPDTLANILNTWREANPDQKLLLVVDQFEELVTLCRNDQERLHFLALLETAVDVHSDCFKVVLTLRSDFEPQLSNLAWSAMWPEARFVVPPMSQAELREAIEGPASVRVLYFEPSNLVDRLIDEVIQTPGALPLLSFTLSEMYIKYLERQSDDRALTEADYNALGGVVGSLRNRATEEYDKLDEVHQATMQRIMLRMVATEGGELARRRVPRSELVYPDEAENQRVAAVIKRLTEARLLVEGLTEGPSGEPEPYVEPAHDALVRAWDKLLVWTRQAEEYLPLQRRLTQAANDWSQATEKKRPDLLWHNNPRLPQVEQILAPQSQAGGRLDFLGRAWRAVFPVQEIFAGLTWLNRRETEFVRQSIRQKSQNLRRLMATVAAIIIVLTGLTIFAFFQQGIANEQRTIADDRRITAEAAQANAVTAEAKAINAAATSEKDREMAVTAEAKALNSGATAVASEATAVVDRENAVTAEAVAKEQRDEAERQSNLSFSREMGISAISNLTTDPELSILLSLEGIRRAYTTQVEDALRHSLLASNVRITLRGHESQVNDVAYSPNGKLIVTAGEDGTARVWDAASGQEIFVLSGYKGPVRAAMFSANGEFIATVNEFAVWIWETETGESVTVLADHTNEIIQAFLSPDGQTVVTVEDCPQPISPCPVQIPVRTWKVNTGQMIAEMVNDGSTVTYSSDGKWLMTSYYPEDGGNNIARVFNASTGEEIATLSMVGSQNFIFSAAFSPNGQWIVTTGEWDHSARVWEPSTGQEIVKLRGHEGGGYVSSADFSSDGQRVVTASYYDETVRVWEAATGEEIAVIRGQEQVSRAYFSPDGRFVATLGGDRSARVWEADTGQEIAGMYGHEERITSLDFSPIENRLATASADGTVRIWEWPGRESDLILEHEATVYTVDFSPDQKWLATASADNTARVWEIATGREVARFDQHESYLNSVDFSPDGKWVVTTSADETARVWGAATGREITVVRVPGQALIDSNVAIENLAAINRFGVQNAQEAVAQPNNLSSKPKVIPASFNTVRKNLVPASRNQMAPMLVGNTSDEIPATTGESFVSTEISFNSKEIGSEKREDTEMAAPDRALAVPNRGGVALGFSSAVFSPDGKWILTAGQSHITAQVWEAATGRMISEMIGHECDGSFCGIWSAVFSPDGQWVLTAGTDGTARIWEAATGEELVQLLGHEELVSSAVFSPDGQWVATAGFDGTARVWEAVTGDEVAVLRGHEGDRVTSVAFSPDGQWVVTANEDRTARIWKTTTGQEVTALRGHKEEVSSATFSDDGQWVVTVSSTDGTVRVWKATTGQQKAVLRGHRGVPNSPSIVTSASFSPNGKWIVSTGMDGTVRFYAISIVKLIELALERVTRELTCQERHDYLHEDIDCSLSLDLIEATHQKQKHQE